MSADSSVDGDIGDLLYNPDLPDKYQGNNVITSLENEEVGGGDAMNQEVSHQTNHTHIYVLIYSFISSF